MPTNKLQLQVIDFDSFSGLSDNMRMTFVVDFFTLQNPVFMLFLGALLTFLLNLFMKRVDVLSGYRKQVIDKRIEACKRIEKTLNPFSLVSFDEDNGKYCHNVIYEGFQDALTPGEPFKTYASCEIELNMAHKFSQYWISNNLNQALNDLIIYSRDTVNRESQTNHFDYRDALIIHGQDIYEEFESNISAVYKALGHEYIELYDVRGFLKSKHDISFWDMLKSLI